MLRGLQDTRVPMLIAGIGYWGIGVPGRGPAGAPLRRTGRLGRARSGVVRRRGAAVRTMALVATGCSSRIGGRGRGSSRAIAAERESFRDCRPEVRDGAGGSLHGTAEHHCRRHAA